MRFIVVFIFLLLLLILLSSCDYIVGNSFESAYSCAISCNKTNARMKEFSSKNGCICESIKDCEK